MEVEDEDLLRSTLPAEDDCDVDVVDEREVGEGRRRHGTSVFPAARAVNAGSCTVRLGKRRKTLAAGLTSVVIWCDRFNLAFGSAPLTFRA
ncbi:hypothetical protein GCM10027053_43340 [Intrasporangium mesophilum]